MKDLLIQLGLGGLVIFIFLAFHFLKMKRIKKEREAERKAFREEIKMLKIQNRVLMRHDD